MLAIAVAAGKKHKNVYRSNLKSAPFSWLVQPLSRCSRARVISAARQLVSAARQLISAARPASPPRPPTGNMYHLPPTAGRPADTLTRLAAYAARLRQIAARPAAAQSGRGRAGNVSGVAAPQAIRPVRQNWRSGGDSAESGEGVNQGPGNVGPAGARGSVRPVVDSTGGTASSKEFSLGRRGAETQCVKSRVPKICFLTGFRPILFNHSPDKTFF